MAKRTGRDRTPERQVAALHLVEFDRDRLESGRDHDGTAFVGRDFAGQDASDARFVERRLERCPIDGLKMRHARLVEGLLADVRGAIVDLADSTWRETASNGSRSARCCCPGVVDRHSFRRQQARLRVNLAGAALVAVVPLRKRMGSASMRSRQRR